MLPPLPKGAVSLEAAIAEVARTKRWTNALLFRADAWAKLCDYVLNRRIRAYAMDLEGCAHVIVRAEFAALKDDYPYCLTRRPLRTRRDAYVIGQLFFMEDELSLALESDDGKYAPSAPPKRERAWRSYGKRPSA